MGVALAVGGEDRRDLLLGLDEELWAHICRVGPLIPEGVGGVAW